MSKAKPGHGDLQLLCDKFQLLNTQGGDGLGNAYFFKKRANFLTESVHCFDSFKSWVRVKDVHDIKSAVVDDEF